jgi:glycosyltransferase 2 family protein
MQDKIIKFGRTLLFLSFGIFLLIIAFRGVHLEDLLAGLLSARYEWVLLSLLFATLAFISRTYRWILLIAPLGHNPSPRHTFYALMSGQLANFIFPRLGEITRCGSLNRTDKIPFDSLLGTVIAERISDLLSLLVLVLAVFLLKIDLFGGFLMDNLLEPLYGTIFSWLDFHWFLWVIVASLVLMALLFYRMAIIWLGKFRIYRKFELVAGRVIEGMKSVLLMEKKLQFIFHTIFIWLMYFFMTAALFEALPMVEVPGVADVLFIMVVGGLGMAAPVQGGIGAYHWIVSVALGLFGIPREEGLVFATLSHESQALFTLLLGSYSLLMIFFITKKVRPGNYQAGTENINLQHDGET